MSVAATFFPDIFRARLINERMHAELKDGLQKIATACEGADWAVPKSFYDFISGMSGDMRALPEDFARYYRTVQRILDGDYKAAFNNISQYDVDLTMGTPKRMEAWSKFGSLQEAILDRFSESEELFYKVSDEDLAVASDCFMGGMDIINQASSDLHREISDLVRDVVFVNNNPNSEYGFDGGTHYQLWGGLVLNANSHRETLKMAEAIVHESCHLFLFGMTVDKPLVFNSDVELFKSPLRSDPRPMDGIYHATYVSARMAFFMNLVLESSSFSSQTKEAARASLDRDVLLFEEGHRVVVEHGKLSELGEALMGGALDAVNSFRA